MSSKYIKLFQTHSEYTAFTSTADFILPNVSYCKDQTDVVHYNPFVDYSNDYLTFIALGTYKQAKHQRQYHIARMKDRHGQN